MALIGAGAQGQVLLDAMLRIPGLRFRAVCDIWTDFNLRRAVNTLKKYKFEVSGLRGLPAAARPGEGAGRGRDRDPRLLARAAHGRVPRGRQARLLREGDVEHARGRAPDGGGGPRDRQAAADRPPAPQQPALPALPRQAARRGEAARAHRDRERPVEPRRRPRPGRARPLPDPRGAAQAVRLPHHARVPQLALVQGQGRRADRGPRLAPDRRLQLVPGRGARRT